MLPLLPAATILEIIKVQSEIVLVLAQKLTDVQLQGLFERHEQRIDWLRGLLDRTEG